VFRQDVVEEAVGVRGAGGVVVRACHLGEGVYTAARLERGCVVLRAWGPRLPHRTRHSIQVDHDVHIDPPAPLRFFNHSCAPNCGLLVRRGAPVVEVHALRAVEAGEELTLDYATFESEVLFVPGPCLCRAPSCRGRVAGYHELPDELRAAYGPYIAEYLRTR